MSKENQELQRQAEQSVSELVFTGDPRSDSEIILSGMIQQRGEQVFEFISSEQVSKHLSPKGLVELHDKLIDLALERGNTIEALAAVQSFQRCKFNIDQILKNIERLYVVAKRCDVNPNQGAIDVIQNHKDMSKIAENISEEDYDNVIRRV